MSHVIAGRRRTVRAATALVSAALVAATTVATGSWAAASTGGSTGAPVGACTPRLLVLSALPVELDPLLAAASVDQKRTVVVSGRSFYQGTLRGNNVIM